MTNGNNAIVCIQIHRRSINSSSTCHPLYLRRRRFQVQRFGGDVEAGDNADVSEDGKEEEGSRDNINGEAIEEQLAFFSKIVQEYIVDGAPNEINIRYKL